MAEDFWAANYPTISASQEAKIIIISTPNGLFNIFHRIWSQAKAGLNTFVTTKVSYEAKDRMGNSNTYSFNVTVADNEIPEFKAPERATVVFGRPVPAAYTSLAVFVAAGGLIDDNCEIDSASFRFIKETRTGSISPFTITRTYRVSDASGNIAEVDHHISVTGSEPILKSGLAAGT